MKIVKSLGITETERLLADLCERTFLNLWSFPNPYKEDGKELCDLLVVFERTAIIFFDREKALNTEKDNDAGDVEWRRWRRRVIDAQAKTAHGAERYLRSGRGVYLDNQLKTPLPRGSNDSFDVVHKVVVAHGAEDACKAASDQNVAGSLAIAYGEIGEDVIHFPFVLHLDKHNPIHVIDSHNLPIILKELDTIWDFTDYLNAKSKAIAQLDGLVYCGEEDLLAHYFLNYDEDTNKHRIGTDDPTISFVMVGEGEWHDFERSDVYRRTHQANEISYLWDRLIQYTGKIALAGRSLGVSPLEAGRSAIHEMAKEPRFSRRALSEHMDAAIRNFPAAAGESARNLSVMSSFYGEKRYVFLQLRAPKHIRKREDFREVRQSMLEIACGVVKTRFPEVQWVVGIAVDPPKFSRNMSEDFLLMDCTDWGDEKVAHYLEANKVLGFLESGAQWIEKHATRFVPRS